MQLNLNSRRGLTANVYLRNSQKHAKVINMAKEISGEDLYSQVSEIFHLTIDQFHLYFEGILITQTSELRLEDKSIIHIVNLVGVHRDSITINVKKLKGRINPVKLEVSSHMKIKDFIDEKLYKVYGEKSNKIFLVYIGKPLNLEGTFIEEDVEDGSQLLCLQLEDEEESAKEDTNNDDKYVIKVKDLQTPQVKDIYPMPNFAINVPNDLHATNNNLHLIFDPKIKHASSINNIELDPAEIIPEAQQTFSDFKKNQSYHSEQLPENDKKERNSESHLSQKYTSNIFPQRGPQQEEFSKQKKKMNLQGDFKFQTGDLIYTGEKDLFPKNGLMGDLLQEYKGLQKYENLGKEEEEK